MIQRELYLNKIRPLIDNELIKVITGIRRCGKSYMLKSIMKYLKAGVMENGVVKATDIGTPQGGNLSPLLSNIMLNELDKELEARGLNFVRYADDCIILVKSEKAATRVFRGWLH